MTIDELLAELAKIKSRFDPAGFSSANVVIGPSRRLFSLYVVNERGASVYAGHGNDFSALAAEAHEAIDARDPAILAKTLGVAA